MSGGADGAIPIADRATADLMALERRLLAQIRRLLAQLDTKRGSSVLERDRLALATATQVRQQVTALLTQRGFTDVVDVFARRALEAAEVIAAESKVPVPTSTRTALERIVRGQSADVAAVFSAVADEMRQAINTGTTMGGSLADLTEQVAARLNVAVGRAAVAVESGIMASGRVTVMDAAAASGLDYVYLYIGPRDGKVRDFCKQLVGRACTLRYISRLDNGAGLPVREYCGGYQCRHSWSPITRPEAIARGAEVYE